MLDTETMRIFGSGIGSTKYPNLILLHRYKEHCNYASDITFTQN